MSDPSDPSSNPRPLTKRELRTLKNTLGKQGITMEQHEEAQKLAEPVKILKIDCFALRANSDPLDPQNSQNPQNLENQNLPDANGWYVGYEVAMNGVGRAGGDSESSEDSDDVNDVREETGESSGFESDPPTEEEDEEEELENPRQNLENRRESDDVSDKGQLLYGLDHQFYVDKTLRAKNCTVEEVGGGAKEEFKTGDLVTTMRFPVGGSAHSENTANTDDELHHHGYQMIGDGSIPCVTSHSEDSEDDDGDEEYSEDVTSSGLWCNFVLSPEGFEGVKKEKIPEEKLKTIPLDDEKLAQISAAMAGFQLPTPPGWEGVSDKKLLEFINQRI